MKIAGKQLKIENRFGGVKMNAINTFIDTIEINSDNFHYIAEQKQIGGTLLLEIQRIMKEYKKPVWFTNEFPELAKGYTKLSVSVLVEFDDGFHKVTYYNFAAKDWMELDEGDKVVRWSYLNI